MRTWPGYLPSRRVSIYVSKLQKLHRRANRCMSPRSPVTRRDQPKKNVTRGGRREHIGVLAVRAACTLDKNARNSFIIALCKFYLKPFGVFAAAAASEGRRRRRRDLVARRPTVCPTCQTRRVRGCDWVMLVDTAATTPIIGPSSAARN